MWLEQREPGKCIPVQRLEKKQRPDRGLDDVKNDVKPGGNSDNFHFEMMVWLLCRNEL